MLLKSRFHLHLPEDNCITFCCTRKTSPFYNCDLTHFAYKVNKKNFPCAPTVLAMGTDYTLSKPSGDRGRRLPGLHCVFYLTCSLLQSDDLKNSYVLLEVFVQFFSRKKPEGKMNV